MRGLRLIGLLFLISWSLPSWGQESSVDEPDIEIRYGEDETRYEYRVNGELVEIKVVPNVGPPYYLIPADQGEWERSSTSRLIAPSWKILEW